MLILAPSRCLVAGRRDSPLVILHQVQVDLFEGMGGWFNRAYVCACLHECPHQLRILLIGISKTDGEDTLGGSRIPDKGQSMDGFDPVRRVSDDTHLGPRSKHATT